MNKIKPNLFLLILKYFFIYSNVLLIIINIFFLFFKKAIKNNSNISNIKIELLKFRNSDYFFLNLVKNSYIQISTYLNNKYNCYSINLIKKYTKSIIFKSNKRKKIIVYSVDLFSMAFHKRWLKSKLKEKFIIKFNSNKPDYLIYNIFGEEHLNPKYVNSIKIAIFTENKIPDFNEADYFIGQYHINYLDRYFKSSIFLWQDFNNDYFFFSRAKAINSAKRIKFCAALISNNFSTDGFRVNFINELSKYKKVDMGGNFNNNIGKPVKNKIEFLSKYKFSIAMENSEGDGYISEKIIDAFKAGTIPIYYGDYIIDEYINPKAFILIKGKKDMLEKIEYIKKIDNDDNLYKNILKEKVLLDDNIQSKNDKELKEFLWHIFEQNKIKANRKFS